MVVIEATRRLQQEDTEARIQPKVRRSLIDRLYDISDNLHERRKRAEVDLSEKIDVFVSKAEEADYNRREAWSRIVYIFRRDKDPFNKKPDKKAA